MTYNSTVLRGSENLRDHLVRSGDTFHVSYLSEGDCAEVSEAVEWLRKMVNELEACTRLPPVGVILPMSPAVEDLGVSAMHGSLDQNLSVSLFYPWGKERHVVNKLHFLHSGGLELLCRLYALVHTVDQWDSLPYWLQCVECICGQSLTNFMETFEFRRHVLKHNGLEMCFKSLLRCSYQDQGAILARQNDALLLHAMEVALYAVCK